MVLKVKTDPVEMSGNRCGAGGGYTSLEGGEDGRWLAECVEVWT